MVLKRAERNLWIACVWILGLEGWVESLEVTVNSNSVQVARGQTAVLPCTFVTSAALNQLNIIWTVTPLSNANQPEQVILYQGGQVISGTTQFNARVGFIVTMPSTSASIFINNTRLSDTGTYQCLVNNLPDRGGRNIGVLGLTVLVPPTIPLCRLQGAADIGNDVTLSCSSEEGIPIPAYSWEKLDSFVNLPPTSVQDQMQGTLILRNISTATNGLYQCTAANAIGSSTCVIDLQVITPQGQNVGIIAGAVVTGILALLLCILSIVVILFYWRSKHKYEEEEIPNEIREDDLPPSSSSIKAFHADGSSENDTLTSSNTYNAHYWQNPKPMYDSNSFSRYNGHNRHPLTATSSQSPNRPSYMNGGHHTAPKTMVVTTSSSSSLQNMVRSNGSISRKAPLQQTLSYTVSHANLQRMGGIPVMVPAQNRAGSLV
ncbi:immunoglobulin superfamily member 11 [Callorhinchus milii]|uniref:Immunoglobulin superfamily member 11 n=1 Tax=Callorhinchus milii TaxID=7868 RepID=A0A4W3H5E9_CALMI|nr:immunoglobulin superfamily member 11 [Callorhinchus milii]|eukprot:gi/632969709/ref/XP_007901230.1/ PREDICTED: immunoglobulin superfamily member 11 [Callorhinchus milii]